MTGFARYLLVPVALFAAGTASAQSWRMTGSSGQAPDRAVFIVDTSSIKRSGDTVEFSSQTIYESLVGDRDYDQSVVRRRGNCRTMQNQYLSDAYYLTGRLLSSSDQPGDWIQLNQGSVGYTMLSTVCGSGAYRTDAVRDPKMLANNYFGR